MINIRRVLLVSGGRLVYDRELIVRSLEEWKPDIIIHGAAIGTDAVAQVWADSVGVATTRIPVKKSEYDAFGNRAPLMRNTTMVHHVLDAYCEMALGRWAARIPFIVMGMFFPGRSGTADCKKKWIATGLDGIEVYPEGWVEFGVV